jgi:hypothetical protein
VRKQRPAAPWMDQRPATDRAAIGEQGTGGRDDFVVFLIGTATFAPVT